MPACWASIGSSEVPKQDRDQSKGTRRDLGGALKDGGELACADFLAVYGWGHPDATEGAAPPAADHTDDPAA